MGYKVFEIFEEDLDVGLNVILYKDVVWKELWKNFCDNFFVM